VIIATARDISARKEAEDQLRKSNNELKKVNAALDAFVYSASHDIKAPLLLELIKHDDPEKAGEYISRMELSIEKLNKFICDLVDYSRNSKMDVQIKKIKINEKVRHLINELQYAEEGESIIFDLQLNTPSVIFSDNFRLEVIIRNLISNSIRYHDKKKNKQYILVRTAVKNNMLILEVIDNGIGIGPEHQEKVFEMFFRANELNKNGSGLGLFMVKEAVELLKGILKIDSVIGEGTKMKVEIPLNDTEL
jgi:signal transduction histidine kinase